MSRRDFAIIHSGKGRRGTRIQALWPRSILRAGRLDVKGVGVPTSKTVGNGHVGMLRVLVFGGVFVVVVGSGGVLVVGLFLFLFCSSRRAA